MHRAVSLRCSERYRVAISQTPSFLRLTHQNVRTSDEAIKKNVTPEKENFHRPNIRIQGFEDSFLKNPPKIHASPIDEKKSDAGEEYWKHLQKKYEYGSLSFTDVITLFRRVYSEAKYEKFHEAPSTAYTISCCGALPLCSIGLLTILTGGSFPSLAYAQLAYSASVLSFFGGVAWGHAVDRKTMTFERLGWAVAPPLLAWSSILLPLPMGFAFTAIGLTSSLVHDVLLTSYPQWFKSIRYILTVVALISLLPAFFMTALKF